MAQLPFSFDASQHKPAGVHSVVPAGNYNVLISGTEYMATKTGTGTILLVGFTITDGENKGDVVKAALNVQNPSEVAVRIGMEELSAICHATGVRGLTETSVLHGKALNIKVEVESYQKDGKTQESNRVKGYRYPDGSEIVAGKFWGEQAAATQGQAFAQAAPPVQQQQVPVQQQQVPVQQQQAPAPQYQQPVQQPAVAPAAQGFAAGAPAWATPPQ